MPIPAFTLTAPELPVALSLAPLLVALAVSLPLPLAAVADMVAEEPLPEGATVDEESELPEEEEEDPEEEEEESSETAAKVPPIGSLPWGEVESAFCAADW